LGLALIIGMVYAVLFNTNPTALIPALFAGINPWFFMSGTADAGTTAFIGAEGYIKQTTVAAQIFPFRITMINFVNLLYSVLAFFSLYLFVKPDNFAPVMLMCIPGLLVIFIFSLGIANLTSVVTLSLRDFQPLQALILQGLFYATPIIFQPEMLKEKGFQLVYELNPFYYMLEIVKKPMLGQQLPELQVYIVAVLIAFTVFILSIFMVMRVQKTVAYRL
jgi:ABC-type polysaccharide/polyol phosphate export permease